MGDRVAISCRYCIAFEVMLLFLVLIQITALPMAMDLYQSILYGHTLPIGPAAMSLLVDTAAGLEFRVLGLETQFSKFRFWSWTNSLGIGLGLETRVSNPSLLV